MQKNHSKQKINSTKRKYAIESRLDAENKRLEYMLSYMDTNKAYLYKKDSSNGDKDGKILNSFKERYSWYRKSWRTLPNSSLRNKFIGKDLKKQKIPPLCIDIEVAAICDLACPFCYRQFEATPDKIINDELAFKLIDQASEMGVPSIKFNWRGEPLMNPKLPEYIDYAKRKGILETIINTNATRLSKELSGKLIDAGIDMIIYSFDGASKSTYEKSRPGRFNDNKFEDVYSNIVNFSEIKRKKNSKLPFTKIQMILTKDTFSEQENFFSLFENYVDDVSLKQYTERGGKISDLDQSTKSKVNEALSSRNLSSETPYFRDKDGELFISTGRLPCEQPYQRLLITYDGRVGMCCYDWGAKYKIGYASNLAISNGDKEFKKIVEKASSGNKGFEMLNGVKVPETLNEPKPYVESLETLWTGEELDKVREAHIKGKISEISICNKCPFKETYQWEKL